MAAVIDDIRHGLRAVTQQPGNSLIIVAVLALGLAGVIGMLSILKAMVWDPLPFPAADRLVQAGWRDRANDFPDDVRGLRGADLLDWRERLGPMARVIGQGQATINLASDEAVERYDGSFVTANLFATLGVAPALGRDFRAEDEQPGAAPVLILSHDLWRTRFGADPGVLGRILRANAMPATVIGVMPPDFSFPYREQVWMNASLSATVPVDQDRNFEVFIEPLTGKAGLAPITAVLENLDRRRAATRARDLETARAGDAADGPLFHRSADAPVA
jgi:putative ABC transport system permease protein